MDNLRKIAKWIISGNREEEFERYNTPEKTAIIKDEIAKLAQTI